MSQINYAVVTHNNIILAQQAVASGNFDQQIIDIITNMNTAESKITIERGNLRFFILHEASGLNFGAAVPSTTQSNIVWDFLSNVSKRFNLQYSRSWKTAPPFGMQQEFSSQLKALMSTATDAKINQIKQNIAESQDTMNEALNKALLRGEKLNDMAEKADNLSNNAKEYERTAIRVKRKMCWEKYRYWLIGAVIVVLVIFIIVLIACGGFTFKECKGKSDEEQKKTASGIASTLNFLVSYLN